MGQNASHANISRRTQGQRESVTSRPLPHFYMPLADIVKIGDANAGVAATASADEAKDVSSKILEFGKILRYLPSEAELGGNAQSLSTEQQLQDIVSSVDSVNELFQYISKLASMPMDPSQPIPSFPELNGKNDHSMSPGIFDTRVASYVKHLQNLYQMTKKERHRYEQRLQSTRTQANNQRKISPPPLPLPTQNCMTMGWDLVVHLLKATRSENADSYQKALQIIKDNLLPLKPTTYSDSMYLAPSASSAFNLLSECLGNLVDPVSGKPVDQELLVGSNTIETLAEVGLARGSLSTMLFVILWLMKQEPNTSVNISTTLSKLASLKEQPMYGKCEASGELYSCGQNSYGELGIGDDIERHQLTSVPLCGWDDIRQVVSGNETLSILTNGGVVLTCGLNKSGQCGQGHFEERIMLLRPVQALRSQKIKMIAASNGCEHMIAITESGLGYSWGYNDRGQLGHENLTTKIHTPKLIESVKDKKLLHAAVSYHHSAIVTESGELYTFGMNDCGQLGLDHTQHMSTPQYVKSLEGQEVSMVSCGLYHTICCTTTGELYAFGKNDYGQLGLGHSRQVKVPTQISIPNQLICFVACGYYHSIALTTSGQTFSFGRNDYGQLGIGNKIHQNSPNVVALSANTRMVRATCGCYHSVLLSEQGQVFLFGRNNKGQLGNRGSADSLLPVALKVRPEKNTRRCIDIAAGFYTTSLIVERKKENDEGEMIVMDQSCIISLCGRVDIDRSGEAEGLSNFGSISTVGVSLFNGKWFYEVEVVSSGLIQIGWIDGYFQGSSDQGEGVGDHVHSWSYDGNRQRRWNSGSSTYGEKWKSGDVIGCLLDLHAGEMIFYRNGISLGVAFIDIKCSPSDQRSGLMPGISLERGEIIRVNLGHQPFAYPPTIIGEFESVSKAIMPPATTVTLKTAKVELESLSRPPALEGSASVLIKDKLFVIGGSIVDDSITVDTQASNHVWVYYSETKKWQRWTDFPIGIRYHQAVAIEDECILVIGGENKSPTSRHMDLYRCSTIKNLDGSIPQWELVQGAIGAATSLPLPRAFHTAATIRVRLDTMVFIYGGKSSENEVLGDAWFLSLDDYSWSRLPCSLSLDPGPRMGCSSSVIGECVYVFGGQDKEEKTRADLWRYNTFDRVWHLTHDDNISAVQSQGEIVSGSPSTPTSDFSVVMPEPRLHYSMMSDLGNIWIYGGQSRSGQMMNDLWFYSITSQKWTQVEAQTDETIEGCTGATLLVQGGVATSLHGYSDFENSRADQSMVYLVGGKIHINGKISCNNKLRVLVAMDTARSYTLDPAKNVSTAGKSSQILSLLRSRALAQAASNTGCSVHRNTQQQLCPAQALDSAICVLSHLDRLAGNDLPPDDGETIQLSRCLYRTLCIDPKEKTFAALLHLLEHISERFVRRENLERFESPEDQAAFVVHTLYPLLVTLRLLKLNFFELSRCCIDSAEIGLPETSTAPGGILYVIRERLFQIAEHTPMIPSSGELVWFFHAVKQETASSIYYGFSILFPSLLERFDVMNRLLKFNVMEKSLCTAAVSSTKKLLVPMLVPCFTSTRMLFQLMSEATNLFETPEKTQMTRAILARFLDTLLESLWERTGSYLETQVNESREASLLTITIKKLDELDATYEFKILNVVLRAVIFWCSDCQCNGWEIFQAISIKLAQFMTQLLGPVCQMDVSNADNLKNASILLEHTFPGKLLPFILLSVFSLPSVRENLSDTLRDFWPHLEKLVLKLHILLKNINSSTMASTSNRLVSAESLTANTQDFAPEDLAIVSKELAQYLSISMTNVTYREVLQSIWYKFRMSAIASKTSKADDKNLEMGGSSSRKVRVFRVKLPVELAKLFGTDSFSILVQQQGQFEHVTTADELFGKELDTSKVSFRLNRTILSQHIYPATIPSSFGNSESCMLPENKIIVSPVPSSALSSTSPRQMTVSSHHSKSNDISEDGWLHDFQKILVWVGSHYASKLIIGERVDREDKVDDRWISSPLFRGGLEENTSIIQELNPEVTCIKSTVATTTTQRQQNRNELLLHQIVENIGSGKRILDKVRMTLDPGAAGSNANPKLRATRLRRQDSVEATLEKSGGFEAVDRAVRATFAVLLKHSNISYMSDPVTKDGVPSEAVLDAWRAALQLRRWIVREQQKLAVATSERTSEGILSPTNAGNSEAAKQRQQMLYNTVCEPLIRRAQLLLGLSPAPIHHTTAASASSPLKLLPGISITTTFDFIKTTAVSNNSVPDPTASDEESRNKEQSARQLKKLMETKSMEMIEEEDERIQADIFAFIQQSTLPSSSTADAEDGSELPTNDAPLSMEEHMKLILKTHHMRGLKRLEGLRTFQVLLQSTETIPSARFHIIPALSSSFKRLRIKSENQLTDTPEASSSMSSESTVIKVHYLNDLEFAGSKIANEISEEFFNLLSSLIKTSTDNLTKMKQFYEETQNKSGNTTQQITTGGYVNKKSSTGVLQKVIHDILLVLEASSMPFTSTDWIHVHRIKFSTLLTDLVSWHGWKNLLEFEALDDSCYDTESFGRYPILSASFGSKYPKIVCSRSITIGTDLERLTLSHKSPFSGVDDNKKKCKGGFAVFDKALTRGRWYWEVTIRSQADSSPIFIGVSDGTIDLNQLEREMPYGMEIFKESTAASVLPLTTACSAGIRWRSGQTIGVFLDCEEKKIDFFGDSKRIQTLSLHRKDGLYQGYLATIGIKDAEVYLDLSAPVPAKLHASSNEFQFSSAVVSGALVASPLSGSTISWDGKARGRSLQLSTDGSTIIAGDCSAQEDFYETAVVNRGFESDTYLYFESYVVLTGSGGRCNMSFGVVGSDFVGFDGQVKSNKVDVNFARCEGSSKFLGVLYDLEKSKLIVYSSMSDPIIQSLDLSSLKKPYLPAVSILCNGAIFTSNFHPRHHVELPYGACHPVGPHHNLMTSTAHEIQVGKSLQMQVYTCDGGEFSPSHGARNCLLDDSSVYSSAKSSNVNMVLKHELDTPFCLSYVSIRGPGPGYSSPVRYAVMFVTSTSPDLESFKEYDGLTPEEFVSLPFPPASTRMHRDENLPVAYFVLDSSCSQLSKQLSTPITGRYVLIKFLCPLAGSNIDVGFIGFCGTFDKENGPAYSENAVSCYSCEECKRSPLLGISYSLRDDETIKLCASCYDDNRNSLDSSFYATAMSDAQDSLSSTVSGNRDEVTVLCGPRRVWNDKINNLLDMTKKAKTTSSVLLSLEPSNSLSNTLKGSVSTSTQPSTTCERSPFATYEECELFSCGQNNYGELCLGHCNSTSKLEHVSFFSGKSVKQIAGGNEVLAVVMKDGAIYTCGLNKSGQCGNGTFEERVLLAMPVRALNGVNIEMVAAANGCEHMLAISSDGSVYSWGYNDRGQLGLGSTISKSHTPRLIESLREKHVVTYAAVSYHHSAVVTSAGEVLTFGMNDCGQLGLDHNQHQHTPQLVDALTSQVISRVACGLYHTVVATVSGEVYTFGKNDYGQLGLGHARNVKVPNLVKISIGDSDEKVVDVCCGYYHTVAITEKGKLITWGRNDYGQLGIGSKDHKSTPQYVPLPLSSKIKRSSCGCYHTLILLSNGRVMVFGRNNKGQLGAGARTLPSADLPLPIPSNSLSNDDVVAIAAGFYSSYILTGRTLQNGEADALKEDGANGIDLPEHHAYVNSDALYESLMREIDRMNASSNNSKIVTNNFQLQPKRTNIQKKLPLIKLHAAAWAMTRALMYQALYECFENVSTSNVISVSSAGAPVPMKLTPKVVVNPVLRLFIDFLIDNLKQIKLNGDNNNNSNHVQKSSKRGNMNLSYNDADQCGSLQNACIGLLKHFASRFSFPGVPSLGPEEETTSLLYYRYQILWVLLACGSVNSDISYIISSSPETMAHIVDGLSSTELSFAMICMRLAMLTFPLHSTSSINKILKTVQPSTATTTSFSNGSGGDILNYLLYLIGQPLVTRPKLCRHELGIECATSSLCHQAGCVKGICVNDENEVSTSIQDTELFVLDRHQTASAKAAEAVSLVRYLTLFPTWKKAVSASLSRGFNKAEKMSEILDCICAYYANVQNMDRFNGVEDSQGINMDHRYSTGEDTGYGLRKPETASFSSTSPEVEEVPSTQQQIPSKQDEGDARGTAGFARDKKSLMLYQKAKDSVKSLAIILAVVSVVGGHIEGFREGCHVIMEDNDKKSRNKTGVLVSVKPDSRQEVQASVMFFSSDNVPMTLFTDVQSSMTSVPLKELRAIERIPAILGMFESADEIITSLSGMLLPVSDEFTAHLELEQPQNNSVQEILRGQLKLIKRQLQWRSTKALSCILKQMPSINSSLGLDSQLIPNIASLIGSESTPMTLGYLNSNKELNDNLRALQNRWLSLKQRQVFLGAETVIHTALDYYEENVRCQVVEKLRSENALSWGLDAIQSPRKNGGTLSPTGPQKSFASVNSIVASSLSTNTATQRSNEIPGYHGSRFVSDLPHGVWGVLTPLPAVNQGDAAANAPPPSTVDQIPFHLSTPIVRAGRAADACDLVVNDRSVSGRHFHLRRVRREDEGSSEEFFELQDFSKNGTIVNGVRIHGTSIRITPGSRISLILSRGGLITYEFQLRQGSTPPVPPDGGTIPRILPPPPIITHQNGGDLNILIPGQEYQQPLNIGGLQHLLEPRSPAEIQNRGNTRPHTGPSPAPSRMDHIRNRIAATQGLRLITSVAESEVPRALISPNPAVDSPRVGGGFSSPRYSGLMQTPGTPAVGSPTATLYNNMSPSGILSPPSHQQRESTLPALDATIAISGASARPQDMVMSEALRIALGRDGQSRSHGSAGLADTIPKTRVLNTHTEITSTTSRRMVHSDMQLLATDLLIRVQDLGCPISLEQCEEAIRITKGDTNEAFAYLKHTILPHQVEVDVVGNTDVVTLNARHLSGILGLDEALCAEALRESNNNLSIALKLLLLDTGLSMGYSSSISIRSSHEIFSDAVSSQSLDSLMGIQEVLEENPSYALLETSAMYPVQRFGRAGGSPLHKKDPNSDGSFSSFVSWSECNSLYEDRIRMMNWHETEQEEEVLTKVLVAGHARKALLQLVRLFQTNYGGDYDQLENPLSAFADRLTIRQLVSFLEPLNSTGSSNSSGSGNSSTSNILRGACRRLDDASKREDVGQGKIQRILTRITTEVMSSSQSSTMLLNLRKVHNLSTLSLSIDKTDQSLRFSSAGLHKLIDSLMLKKDEGRGGDRCVNENIFNELLLDTMLHIISRTYAAQITHPEWDLASPTKNGARKFENSYPKGPFNLSCGLEVILVTHYQRVWSIPSPDPLIRYRHKWRKRTTSSSSGGDTKDSWMKSPADYPATIWRPTLPTNIKLSKKNGWFNLGDVVRCGNEVPDSPILMVYDDGTGLLMPPIGFERVDVTGKGLPKNSEEDIDFHQKQIRSIWWPIAPPGYVATGCIAGHRDAPFDPPSISSVRCIREDLVKRVSDYRCIWRAEKTLIDPILRENSKCGVYNEAIGTGNIDTIKQSSDSDCVSGIKIRNQSSEAELSTLTIHTSLWSISTEYCNAMIPVLSSSEIDGIEPTVAFTLNLSEEDSILCAPITIGTVLRFVEVLLHCHKLASVYQQNVLLRPELAAALFALIKQVLSEKLPNSGTLAVDLIRALITVIRCGGKWKDKQGLLYCRSKVMLLYQDQDGGLMLNSLLQAFVELLLVTEERNRQERSIALASSTVDKEKSSISLPYRFHFETQVPKSEMFVSHSSKMAVARQLSSSSVDERKFLLEYHLDETANPPATQQLEGTIPEFYSCRFENTPKLVTTMPFGVKGQEEIKAEIIYYEIQVLEWSATSIGSSVCFGFSPVDFPLEGACVGVTGTSMTPTVRSYSFSPVNGKVQCTDMTADHWKWNEQTSAISNGDVFGCGLRIDTQEVFFTKNGQLLGTAFSSIISPWSFHPTISFNADCKLLVSFGAVTNPRTDQSRVSFHFRFNSMDCDNFMGAFEWYEQLSQVYSVMQSLMHPSRMQSNGDNSSKQAALPDEFMLSADNFLSEISEEVCIRVESNHPYDLDLQEALVNIPLATSIRVKLDQRCETANSHCLQILHGGDNAEGSESEVRAFTGSCGGQEVTIEGDSFIWRFPVQSNFQCRVDRIRKGPYLKLENRDTRLSLTRDKGWQTAVGVARFDSGVHIWEVRINFVTASSNIFLGIARRDVRLDSYLGKDNRGWGWIGNRALWHNGSKQRGTYGEKFKTGDVVRMTLDLKRGTLSYALNGKELGVAFGPGGTGPKLEGTFYPGFALYNQRDSIDLVGGHRVEDGGGPDGLPRGLGVPGSAEDIVYYSEDDEEGGAGGEGEEGIPNFRMELAHALSQMGFPMDWCIYALKHCEDDAEQAADFILANMHAMEVLVREETENYIRRAAHVREESSASASGIALSINEAGDGSISVDTVTGGQGLGGGERSEEDDDEISGVNPTAVTNSKEENGGNGANSNVDKWGIAFTAVPEFSVTGRRLLATKYAHKLQELHAAQAQFALEHDTSIVQIVNEIVEARSEALLSCDPLRMVPEEFEPSEEQLRRFPNLQAFTLKQLQKRFLILRNFNCRLQNSLSFIDFSIDNERSLLAKGMRLLRGCIFQHVKLAWWLSILKEQQSPAAARPEIEVDRHLGREATEQTGIKNSVFAQVFDQLQSIQPSLLRGADRAFKCQFVGEFGDDFGGLYRECLAQISSELQSKILPLLKPCPNALNMVGENRECYVPNVHLRYEPRLVQMAEFLGKLMGIAIRTKTPLDLNLPAIVWKLLVHQNITRKDIENIHQGCFQVVDTIQNINTHGITESMFDEIIDATFTVLSSTKEEVELVPGGRHVRVAWEDKEEYAKAVEKYRLEEFQPICEDILRGIATILPAPTLTLFTWKEFLTLVCGKPTVDIELLRRRTIYGDGCQGTDPHITYFWDVLSEFTDEQKSSFLRFVWGRSRLPTHAADFTQDFKISGLPKAVGRADMYLPIAHTCFFSIDLPAYTSREVMKEKLMYAITHCQSIDADNTTVAQRAGQGLNWTATTTSTGETTG